MAAAVDSEDSFYCSICLDLFKKPVTTPCGHNFCKTCITVNWDLNSPYVCPLCKQRFSSRPPLKINTLVAEMVAKIKSSHKARAGPGEVPCDVCPEPNKLKAHKSCLDCVASYCQSHLEPHQAVTMLKMHELIKPVLNLKDRVCSKHDRPLKQFCQTDQSYLCFVCSQLEHRNHTIVSLKEAHERKKSSLLLTQTKNQDLVKQRRQKIQEIQRRVELSQRFSDREVAAGQQACTALIESIQSSLNQLLEDVHEKQKQTRKQAQDLVRKLELEISELEKRGTEVEKLLQCEDHFDLLQQCTSLPPVEVKDCSNMSLLTEISMGRAAQLLSELKDLINVQINNNVFERIQRFAVDVMLDPSTANVNLTLSDDLKQVHHTDKRKTCSDSTQRFSDCPGVLGKQGFSVKFYFEVQVKEKTEWDIGVALETVHREGSVRLHPISGYWSIGLRRGSEYYACTGACLFLKTAPLKVGVFVDYPRGQVDFYDVHTAELIHSFTSCNFPQKLLPFFSPGYNHGGTNSSPLVLMTVKNQHNQPKKRKQ